MRLSKLCLKSSLLFLFILPANAAPAQLKLLGFGPGTGPNDPPPLFEHSSMATLAGDMFVVSGLNNAQDNTWGYMLLEFPPPKWARRVPANPLLKLGGADGVFDIERDEINIFGGDDGVSLTAQTIIIRNPGGAIAADAPVTVVVANPAHSPSARADHAMAYDSVRGRTVLFGGTADFFTGTFLNDTWEWNGSDWTEIATPTSPAVRYDGQIVYHERLGRTVLFGGANLMQYFNDTWTYDGSNWEQLSPLHSPEPRIGHAMAYHAARGTILMFGGFSLTAQPLGDLWEFDGTDWIEIPLTNGPAPRAAHTMEYDAVGRRVILFGGSNYLTNEIYGDTWSFTSGSPATFEAFGVGCPGTAGIPILDAAPGSWPWINDTFTVQLNNLPPANGTAFVIVGFSNTDWGGFPLPGDLSPFGMWGCTGYVSVDLAIPVATVGGAAQFQFQLPLDPSLAGVHFYNQALVLDPGVNPFGAVVTNAAEGVIGRR